jgi:hypothetical protein
MMLRIDELFYGPVHLQADIIHDVIYQISNIVPPHGTPYSRLRAMDYSRNPFPVLTFEALKPFIAHHEPLIAKPSHHFYTTLIINSPRKGPLRNRTPDDCSSVLSGPLTSSFVVYNHSQPHSKSYPTHVHQKPLDVLVCFPIQR